MEKDVFDKYIKGHHEQINRIKAVAHEVHAAVNQHYDKVLPYSVHLDAVADMVMRYGWEVCADTADILPIIFGAYMHDSIEDARLTYNDVTSVARMMMDEGQAYMAAEIVYALTNEKGRNRSERANERYYEGIRTTPYAPICKMADRLANVSYSAGNISHKQSSMKDVYAREMSHFIDSVVIENPEDTRLAVPAAMIEEMNSITGNHDIS